MRLKIQLLHAAINPAVGHAQRNRFVVVLFRFLVAGGRVGLLHQIIGLLEVVDFLLFKLFDLLADRAQIFRLAVVAVVAMAAVASALAENIFAFVDGLPLHIAAGEKRSRPHGSSGSRLPHFLWEQRPQPVLVISVGLFNTGGGASVALMASGAGKFFWIMQL